jgi:hypothetical protein
MKALNLGSRVRASLLAAAAGWAAAMAATLPIQFAKIAVNATGAPWDLLWSLAAGAMTWGAWSIAIGAGAWFLEFVSLIMVIPERWLLRHPRWAVVAAGICGWLAVLIKFEVWRLLQPYHYLAVRMFSLYSILLIVFTSVSAGVYLRLIAQKKSQATQFRAAALRS